MNLKKLSNKTLVRFLEELRGAMAFASQIQDNVRYNTLEELYNDAMAEFRQRTKPLGDFERLRYN